MTGPAIQQLDSSNVLFLCWNVITMFFDAKELVRLQQNSFNDFVRDTTRGLAEGMATWHWIMIDNIGQRGMQLYLFLPLPIKFSLLEVLDTDRKLCLYTINAYPITELDLTMSHPYDRKFIFLASHKCEHARIELLVTGATLDVTSFYNWTTPDTSWEKGHNGSP